MNRIFSLIVTYGERYHLVEQVVHRLIEQGVSKIVLVDNGSSPENKSKIKALTASVDGKLVHIDLTENKGSAGGIYEGLNYLKSQDDFDTLWILDDDNLPEKDSLKALIDNKEALAQQFDDPVLYSYRGDLWIDDRLAVTLGYIKAYQKNNFIGFNSWGYFKKLYMRRKIRAVNFPIVRTQLGPYGGMFISKQRLQQIGLPRTEFYLYADDLEYTLRLNAAQVDQFLIYASRLKDIDVSFDVANRIFDASVADARLFYKIRNHVYLSQAFIDSHAFYFANKTMYLLLKYLSSLKYFFKHPALFMQRVRLIKQAIHDGERGIFDNHY